MSALSTAILSVPLFPLKLSLKVVVEFDGERIELFVHALNGVFDMSPLHIKLRTRQQGRVDVGPDSGLVSADRSKRLSRKITKPRK